MNITQRARKMVAAVLGVACVSAVVLSAGPVAAAEAAARAKLHAPVDIEATELAWGVQQVPKGSAAARRAGGQPNPYLSLLADPSQVDYATWRATMTAAGQAREQTRRAPNAPLPVQEQESGGDATNDTAATAEPIPTFGTGRREHPAVDITGSLAAPGTPVALPPPTEDDGSIPLAGDLGLSAAATTQSRARIGDGPHGFDGDGTGDFDFYRVDGAAGEFVTLDIDTPTGSELDTVIILWTAQGEPIALSDDFGTSRDSLLMVRLPAAGPFYLSVASFPNPFPGDPFVTGSGFGAGSEGDYTLTSSTASDVDTYAFNLEPGDVLGASVSGAGGELDLTDPSGVLVIGSNQDASVTYPATSPLPGGGNAVLAHVADTTGRHTLQVLGTTGDYRITLEVYRAGGETSRRTQTIFLDFDGARLNTNVVFGPGVRTLSPLTAFLPGWGLTAADERRVISGIVAEVKENLETDPRTVNRRGKVEILNSRDHRDPFGKPGVSRVIIGGSISESGIPTIGIAQSIDPGNFGVDETALVLLDVLSGPADPTQPGGPSLNEYLTPASDRVAFVGQAVGNIVSHEIGHYVGNYHVDQFNESANLMDQGGNPSLIFGVGPDGIGGTPDDPDVDFGEDTYNPFEGFLGIEDTLSTTAFGLTRR